jgi:hypothetical protein
MDAIEIIENVVNALPEGADGRAVGSLVLIRWKNGQLVVDLETNEIATSTFALSSEDAKILGKVEAQLRSTLTMKAFMETMATYESPKSVKSTGSLQ